MSSAAHATPSVLSPEDLGHFARNGFVRLEQAFSRELALEMQDEIWRELAEEHAIERDDRSTWKREFSIELTAKCFMHAITWRCRPSVSAAAISPTWCGSSP